jgi:hypothetical protein
VLAAGIDPAADGWTVLRAAQGVSGDGSRIAGFGTRNGNTEAFVAVIPERAAGVTLLAIGSLALLRRTCR